MFILGKTEESDATYIRSLIPLFPAQNLTFSQMLADRQSYWPTFYEDITSDF